MVEDKMVSIAQSLERKGIIKGRQEGIQKGKRLGERKGQLRQRIQMAKKMLRFGEDIKKIALFTGLSIERIKKLQ
jgi:predicted transposase/invertase (TIGR01784 family)